MTSNSSGDNNSRDFYGQLLYFQGRSEENGDPYKGEKVIHRLSTDEVEGLLRFDVPKDNMGSKMDKFMFLCDLEVESNYVPDNDWHAKLVNSFTVKMMNNVVDCSFSKDEYAFVNHWMRKLNFPPDAEDVELFSSGHYDSRNADAQDLNTFRVPHNNKTLVENRQFYAEEKWISRNNFGGGKEKLQICSDSGSEELEFEQLSHVYSVRAPIAHGLFRQRRCLPKDSNMQFEIWLAPAKTLLMKHHGYRKCRLPIKKAYDLVNGIKFHPDVELKTVEVEHLVPQDCECAKWVTAGRNVEEGFEILKTTGADYNAEEDYKNCIGKDAQTFKPHRVIYDTIRLDKDDHYCYFYKKFDRDDEKSPLPDLRNHRLESVFTNPGSAFKPFISGKTARIPFYSSRMRVINQQRGQQSYTIELSDGDLPSMIIFTGMSFKRRSTIDYDKCITKTSINEKGFEIEEFTVFIDGDPVFRTPWRSPLDHYINFLKHIGRFDNKAVGGAVDFTKFKNEGWVVPMRFDDRKDMKGLVTCQIKFKNVLDDSWDALVMKVSVDDLIMDSVKQGT